MKKNLTKIAPVVLAAAMSVPMPAYADVTFVSHMTNFETVIKDIEKKSDDEMQVNKKYSEKISIAPTDVIASDLGVSDVLYHLDDNNNFNLNGASIKVVDEDNNDCSDLINKTVSPDTHSITFSLKDADAFITQNKQLTIYIDDITYDGGGSPTGDENSVTLSNKIQYRELLKGETDYKITKTEINENVINKYSITVNCIDQTGKTLYTENKSLLNGSKYDMTSFQTKDFEYYTNKGTDDELVGAINDSNVVITINYERNQVDAIMHFVDTEGNTIMPDATVKSNEGEAYDFTEQIPDINYYHAVDETNIKGDKLVKGTEITVIYARNKSNVTIHYVDENNNKIADDVVKNVEAGIKYDFSSDVKNVDYYTAVNKTLEVTGENENSEVNVVYSRNKNTVTIKYLNESGKTIAEDSTVKFNQGSPFDATSEAKSIKYYTLISDISTLKGDTLLENKTIILTYSQNEGTVTINYVDELGKKIEESIVEPVLQGNEYDFTSLIKNIDYYTIKSNPDILKGVLESKESAINVVYSRNKNKITVNYVDIDGKLISDSVIKTVDQGGTYDYSDLIKNIPNYTTTDDGSGLKFTEITKDQTVNIIYSRNKNKVTVNYVDTDGNKLLDSVTKTVDQGGTYDLTDLIKEIPNYTTSDNGSNLNFIDIQKDQTVNIVYVRNKNKVTINYVDKDGKKVADSITKIVNQGDSYNFSNLVKDIPNYTTTDNGSDLNFVDIQKDQVVNIVYTKNENKITVNYLDADGNKITESVIKTVDQGKTYDFSNLVKEIPYYTTTNDGSGLKFIEIQKDQIVNIIYTRNKNKIVVNYVDEDGNKISDSVNRVVDQGKSYNLSSLIKDIQYYTTKDDGSNLKFNEIKKDQKIDVVYKRNQNTITINYVDTVGNKISDTVIRNVSQGKNYNFTDLIKKIDYYTVKTDGSELNFEKVEKDNIINVVYARNIKNITIKYVGHTGTTSEILDSAVKSFEEGTDYNVSEYMAKTFKNYTYTETKGDLVGKVTDNIIIEINYNKNQSSYKINYVDNKTGKVLNTLDYNNYCYYGEKYNFTNVNLKSHLPDNYQLTKPSLSFSGIADGSNTFEVLCVKNQASVIVNYYDIETNQKIQISQMANIDIDAKYNMSKYTKVNIKGYSLEKVSNSAIGVMTSEGAEINVYYKKIIETNFVILDKNTEKNLNGAIIRLLDQNNKEIATWTTGKTPKYFNTISAGRYTIIFDYVPDGYVLPDSKDIAIKNTLGIQEISILIDEEGNVDVNENLTDDTKTNGENVDTSADGKIENVTDGTIIEDNDTSNNKSENKDESAPQTGVPVPVGAFAGFGLSGIIAFFAKFKRKK